MQTTVIRGNQVGLIPLPRAGGALLRTAPSIGDAFSSVKCQSIQRACFYRRRICLGPSVRRRYPRHVWTWTLLAATSPRAALAAHAPYSSVAPAVPLAIGRHSKLRVGRGSRQTVSSLAQVPSIGRSADPLTS